MLRDGDKMSKSRGNVVGVDETAERNGVDAMRLFLLYVTPPEDTSNWTDDGISGRVRLLNRIWRACEPFFARHSAPHAARHPEPVEGRPATPSAKHPGRKSACYARCTSWRSRRLDETRSHRFHYNATIARIDELVNAMTAADEATRGSGAMEYAVNALPILVAPFAPHIAEELWARMGHAASVHLERYVEPDETS